jgi:hypothetical protein
MRVAYCCTFDWPGARSKIDLNHVIIVLFCAEVRAHFSSIDNQQAGVPYEVPMLKALTTGVGQQHFAIRLTA